MFALSLDYFEHAFRTRKTNLNYKWFSKVIFIFPLSLARGKSLRTTRNLSVSCCFYSLGKHVISTLLPWILPVLYTSASVSYAG